MIRYKNVLQKLKEAGYNTSRLRQEKLLSESVIANLRVNKSISMITLNELCRLCQCKPEELIEYIPDEEVCSDKVNAIGMVEECDGVIPSSDDNN